MGKQPTAPTPANSDPNSNPNPNPNRKSRSNKPSSLNPNWVQLQSKLRLHRHRNPHSEPESAVDTILGKRKERPSSDSDLATGLNPLSDDTSLTKVLAIDCEMVGVGFEGSKSALARVTLVYDEYVRPVEHIVDYRTRIKSGTAQVPDYHAIVSVNSWGNVVYDEYVRPVEHIVDYRTRISGIRPKHMKKAKEFWAVQERVAELIKGRIIVGHALHHDLKALLLSHPKKDTRDTSEYEPLRRGAKTRALRDLAAEILRVKIQQKEHCPVEDARAAMYIYNKHKKVWEKSLKDQFRLKNKLGHKKKKKL